MGWTLFHVTYKDAMQTECRYFIHYLSTFWDKQRTGVRSIIPWDTSRFSTQVASDVQSISIKQQNVAFTLTWLDKNPTQGIVCSYFIQGEVKEDFQGPKRLEVPRVSG